MKKAGQPKAAPGAGKRRGRKKGQIKLKASDMAKVPALAAQGKTKKEIARALGVDPATYWRARKNENFLQFFNPIKAGEEKANAEIELSLYNRARGFTYFEEIEDRVWDPQLQQMVVSGCRRIRKYQIPETHACLAWLNNRSPQRWSRRPEDSNKPATVIFQFIAVGADGKQEVIEWDPRKPAPIQLNE